ncbi:hypothetical protein WJU16_22770 [Chitinophaga pollutisoli]|uniref:Uncharacterized protein n=1 Tax=Chitinophaga pollutisoli TaxID=3133966 RepID=A0ABZ2YMQ1_9BACT
MIWVRFGGKQWEVPVRITTGGLGQKIVAVLEGMEICFEHDEHDGLRAVTHHSDFDPELLYQIGKGIQEQRT